MTYFHMNNATLSSALSRITAEFGMGSGGSNSLWSPSKIVTIENIYKKQSKSKSHQCYMIKPHGQLVLVSSTPCSAYTPSLSTS